MAQMYDPTFPVKYARTLEPEKVTRGVQPTYVTGEDYVLSKVAKELQLSYEIRLASYIAECQRLQFVLLLRPDALVSEALNHFICTYHGDYQFAVDAEHYSVYFGSLGPGIREDGWVLGEEGTFAEFQAALKSEWLKKHLQIGAILGGDELHILRDELQREELEIKNLDGENVKLAMLHLLDHAIGEKSDFYIQ